MTLHEGEVAVDSDLVRALLHHQRSELADLAITQIGGGTDNTMYRVGADHVARFPRTRDKVRPLQKELTWLPRLGPGGTARLVVSKNLGADTLQRWLTEQGYPCERAASDKGFRVLAVGSNAIHAIPTD